MSADMRERLLSFRNKAVRCDNFHTAGERFRIGPEK